MTYEMIDHTLFAESMLFAELEEKELEIIVKASNKRDLLRGDVLFRENDKPDSLFLVDSGAIKKLHFGGSGSFLHSESISR